MRAPGEILLLSCYELGHQPIGLASPLGFLARAGFAPTAIDLAVDPLDEAAVRRARFIGISVPMHTALRLGVRVAESVRAWNPTAHLCFFGLYAPLHEAYLRARGADSILGGEFEAELVAEVERSERGDPRRARSITLQRLDFAVPKRAALPGLERYARIVRADGSEGIAGYTEASRGCLHRCRHCPIPPLYDGRFFVVPEAIVLADVRRQLAAGASHITLGDPDFLNGPRHGLAILRALHAEFPSLTFDITAKIEHLLRHRDLLGELGALGCLFIVSAVESLSDRVLAILDKGHTRSDVAVAIELTRAAGIALRPSLVPFTPWSTLDDYLDLLGFIDAQSLATALDPVQLAIRLLVPPGSLLLRHEEMQPHLSALDEAALTYRWTHPDPRMDLLQREVYRAVERAAERGDSPTVAIAEVRRLAERAAGRAETKATLTVSGPLVPHLTEPWFC